MLYLYTVDMFSLPLFCLQANVMLEYSLVEARALLLKNIVGAERQVADLSTELDFVKTQLTTIEVNMARLHNYGVQLKKNQAETGKSTP